MSLNVALVPGPDQVVVRFAGDADLSTLAAVTGALHHSAGLGTRQVVVDLATASFWDCSCLRALAAFTSELAAAGRSCRIVGAPPRTRRLITLADLADRLVLDGPLPSPAPPAPVARSGAPTPRPVSGHPVPVRTGQTPVGAGRPSLRD